MSAGGVVLSSTYPRRELTGDMDQESLAQLGLVPTGVIVVRFNKVKTGGYPDRKSLETIVCASVQTLKIGTNVCLTTTK